MIKKKDESLKTKFFHALKLCIKAIYFPLCYLARKIYGKFIKTEDKITFATFQGNYACNPKSIAEEIIRRKLPYKLVWVAYRKDIKNKESLSQYPKEMKIVIRNSMNCFKEAASSKIWVDNALNMPYMHCPKKKEQVVLQTWHGSMGIKKIDSDSVDGKKIWIKRAYEYARQTSYCISNSTFETNVFRETYWKETPILEYGHARNDILFPTEPDQEENLKRLREKVLKYFALAPEKKLFLYAPTYRTVEERREFPLDYDRLREALAKRFGGDWAILVRFHYKERDYYDVSPDLKDVYNATKYPDIQELIAVCDSAMTDYSSWICDWVLTKKPAFIFAPDIDRYDQERGFYYRLDSTPFPIALSDDELDEKILGFDEKKYESERLEFLRARGSVEDGKASKRIVDLIEDIMKKK